MNEFILTIFVIKLSFHSTVNAYLVVPATSPTRHQLIAGLGVPLNLEHEAITYGWTIKAQYMLPESTPDDLKWGYFPGIWGNFTGDPPKDKVHFAINTVGSFQKNRWRPFPNGGRRRKREVLLDKSTGKTYEVYNAEVNEIGSEPLENENNVEDFDDEFLDEGKVLSVKNYPKVEMEDFMDTSGTRWLLYDGFGRLLTSKGFEGKFCILKAICEAAENKFGYHSGLFGQLFHIIFTPSTTHDPIVNKDHYDYVKAEILGESGEPCWKIFHQCKRSIMDIFTEIYDTNF